MQETIQKLVNTISTAKGVDYRYAETLRRGIEEEHGELPGLKRDYEFVKDSESSVLDKSASDSL